MGTEQAPPPRKGVSQDCNKPDETWRPKLTGEHLELKDTHTDRFPRVRARGPIWLNLRMIQKQKKILKEEKQVLPWLVFFRKQDPKLES